MPPRAPLKPTPAELEILQVLWARGPSTVREVAEELGRAASYTTVLKLMQIMADKRLVKREEESRAHVYRAFLPRQHMQLRLVKDLAERAFGGSMLGLLQQAVSGAAVSKEELRALRELIEREEKRKP
ncbi:MAG: BlaI/MecI/CopY family transcriptional regulator [Bryobacterales bacterium]|nr:BlaI/MecI/CopY family transcriptional regulator [Bryobacterales bacterium]